MGQDGILHTCVAGEEPWYQACADAGDAGLEQIAAIDSQDRAERSKASAILLHKLADEFARHPRYKEATSAEKREYMAEKLFGDQLSRVTDFTARSIANRAELVFWWDVEPIERVSKAERVRELRASGESIRNIAAILKLSEARVRAAIAEEPSLV